MSYLAFLSLQTSALFMRENGDSLLSLIGSYVATHITGAREQKRMVVRSLRSLQAFDLGKAYSQMLLIRRTFTHQRDIKEASKGRSTVAGKVSQEWSGNSSLLWCSDLKPAIDIVKAELCALKHNEHVRVLGLLRWDKLNGHRHKVCFCSPYLRPKIELCMRWIAA